MLACLPSHDERARACTAAGIPDLLVGDGPVLGLIHGEKFVQCPHAPVVLRLAVQRRIDPRAEVRRTTIGDCCMGCLQNVGIHRS